MRWLTVPLLVIALTSCSLVDWVGTGAARSAKLPIPACPETTLTLEEDPKVEGGRISFLTEDYHTVERWVMAWQECAQKRAAVIEEANR